VAQQAQGREDHDDDDRRDPAGRDAHVAVRDAADDLLVDADRAALSDQLQDDALQAEEERECHDERRDADLGHEEADHDTDDGAGHQRGGDGESPRLVVLDDQQAHDGGRGAARHAGGQVDVAEQQHGHERHREDDDRAGLRGQVGHVEVRQEPVVRDPEDDEQRDEPEDRGQGAHVATADALDVRLDRVAEGVGLREVGREARLLRIRDDVSHVRSPRFRRWWTGAGPRRGRMIARS
jgi:hypothetical protein